MMAEHGLQVEGPMPNLVTSIETISAYFVVAGALIGTTLSAVEQFYPIF